MDYNARMSQQFRSQNSHGNNGKGGKQQQPDSDTFMRLVSLSPLSKAQSDLDLLTSMQA